MVKTTGKEPSTDDVKDFVVSGKVGEYIFREDDTGTEMFIIQEGEIEIQKLYGIEQRRLAVLETGDFFGEMSLLEETPRQASAIAITDFKLLKIDHSTFDQMVQENPEIAVRMLRKLSHRLRQHQEAELKATRIAEEVLSKAKEEETPAEPVADGTPPPTKARALLIHQQSGAEFQLKPDAEITIGRLDRVTGLVPEIDFTDLDTHRSLSRRHAKILWSDDGFYLREEIGTSNGTFINGKRLKTGSPVKLEDGDEIRFGFIKTTFQCR